MKYLKFLFLIILFFNFNSLRKIVLQSHKENTFSKNSDFVFRWWDIVEVKKDSKKCNSNDFEGTTFLPITCRDYEIGRWIKTQVGEEKVDILSIVPAQTLFYRLQGLNYKKTKYLTITWNDFSNRAKAYKKFNNIFDSINNDCKGEIKVVFILLPTSEMTLKTSKSIFSSKNEKLFSQEFIENRIKNEDHKCINRKILQDNSDLPIVYYIEFFIDNLSEENIL